MKKIIIAALLFASMSLSAVVNAGCYSSGVRKGVIQKFSQKGFVNKSWEGELVQEGIGTQGQGSTRTLTNVWKFSVTDANVAAKVDQAVFDTGGNVVVKYCQSLIRNPLTQNTSYEVVDVKAVGK